LKSESETINRLRREFIGNFGENENVIIVRSPGRINFIGEHTDYNEGFVLPSAIDRAIYLCVAPRSGPDVRIHSADFKENYRFDVNSPTKSETAWADYLIGVVAELRKAGFQLRGFDCAFTGNIPIGAGMSSSAAVETGLAFALNEIFDFGIDRVRLAKMSQRSENEFVGVRCGIMDQFANLLSKEDSAIYLDCRSLEYEYIPFMRKDLKLALCHTGVKRSLASSEFNLRRHQCEAGVAGVKDGNPEIHSLRDVNVSMLDSHKGLLSHEVYKRCRYVLEENARVDAARQFLQDDDYIQFGELLYLSHQGLRDQYEVSCRELDVLVESASSIEGVLGARMMGGGFGGCTLNLVEGDAIEQFKGKILQGYMAETGKTPRIYECGLTSGTKVILD
jgi:galactokinase